MSLISRITSLAQAVAADVKALYANQGSLAALTTTAKTSLVAAINEVRTVALAGGGGGAAIDDAATATGTTWSSTKISTAIGAAVSGILGSASAAYDTLQEIQALLEGDATSISGLLTAVGNRIRFDAAQTLTTPQQAQACGNIGVGDPETDFVSAYNTAKA